MGNSILKKMASLYNKLQYAYRQGHISYPRVFNDYISYENMKFYEYPHKPLQTFDDFSVPLAEESYIFDKSTLPLYLTHENISTPATLLKNIAYIDVYFDDNMRLRENTVGLEQSLEDVMSLFREEAEELYMQEVTSGDRRYEMNPADMNDIDLLHVAAKDGDTTARFKMDIVPYSIELAPYTPIAEQEQKDEYCEDGKEDHPKPLQKPAAFKIFASPSQYYKDEIVRAPISIDSFNDLIVLENIRQQYVDREEARLQTDERHANKIENYQHGVSV